MASRIQGITVEIGGDTTKLSKALESVNKSIKGTQSGLKDVNKLLKLDPSNTELVVQKQKMLKDAIEATKEKLATLKTAAQQANEQLANGEITQQQYDALQREIVETEQNLRSLQDQAATTNATLAKIDEAGEKLQNIGSSVENVGKKFLPVTAAVTGLGTAAVKTAADFDSEMSKVSAISGATGDDFDQLRAKAREMGAKTKFSASEAASAMEYMAMAGWKTSDMLNGIEGVMNLAAASGEDLATTSDIVTDALTAFGLSAADSGHFADILAAASSNANTNVSMMGETFKYCAPIAGALGFSAEDTAEAIGLMANSGIKASQAGTSLRTIMNNLSGEVTFVGKNIGEVTIATSNADGSMRSLNDILADCRVAFSGLSESEKAANAEALVGKNAMSGFLALMNSSETDINKLRGAIENCDGASESMAETMQDNLNGQLTILKSQLEELAISFGDILMPTIRKIVSAVQQFVDKLNSMDESTRETIIKIGLLAASIGPLLIVLGKTISTIGTAMRGFSSLAKGVRLLITHVGSASGVFSKLGVVLGGLSGPVVAVVAVIGTLVAAFMNFWNTNEEFRTAITSIWNDIVSKVKGFCDQLTQRINGLGFDFKDVTEVLKAVWDARQYLSFAGKSSKDFLLYLSGPGVYDSPAADVESTSVPGRNGDILTENAKAGRRRYQNVDIKYKAFFFNGLPAKTAAVKAWLLSPVGYQKLQDTYDPDFFRMAVCKDALAFDVTAQKAAEMELAFNCKPQRWSVDGQRTIRLDGRSTLKNPFAFPAQPIFKVYGDSGGELYVGEEKITIHSIKDYVLLNCETHNAYNASGFCNETILSDDFPELPEGKTQITWTGGITAVEVIPRWWTL